MTEQPHTPRSRRAVAKASSGTNPKRTIPLQGPLIAMSTANPRESLSDQCAHLLRAHVRAGSRRIPDPERSPTTQTCRDCGAQHQQAEGLRRLIEWAPCLRPPPEFSDTVPLFMSYKEHIDWELVMTTGHDPTNGRRPQCYLDTPAEYERLARSAGLRR